MNAWYVALKDMLILLRDRGQLLTMFLLPVLFVVVFGAAFAAGQDDEEVMVVPVVNLDSGGELSQMLLGELNRDRGIETQDYDEARAQDDLAEERIHVLLHIPADLSADVEAGKTTTLRLLYGPGAGDTEVEAIRLVVEGVASELSLQTQLISGLSQMGAMTADAPEDVQVFTAERIRAQAEEQFERSRTRPLIALVSRLPEQVMRGREEFNPSSLSIAGIAVLFVFLTAQATARSIFDEKREGTFRRLLAAPMGKWEVLSGKALPNLLLGVLQVVIIFALSIALMPLLGLERPSLGNSPVGLVVLTIVVALCSTSLGILIAALARTESQVGGISTLILWVAGLVSGAFIPAFVLGDFLNTIGKIVPQYWALQAYNNLMIRGQGLVDILPELGILLGFTAVFFVIGLLRFKFD